MTDSIDYRRAFEAATQELAELVAKQEALEKRKLTLRKTIELLATICENEGIAIETSAEADYIKEHSGLADEIRRVMRFCYPMPLQPLAVKKEIESLGYDLAAKYGNAQATIHMVLKRMYESGELAEVDTADGKKAYSYNLMWVSPSLRHVDEQPTHYQRAKRQPYSRTKE